MQKILLIDDIGQIEAELEKDTVKYISERLTETYEEFDNYSIISFDMYEKKDGDGTPQVLVYTDREDLFFLCENKTCLERVKPLIPENETNERALWLFFRNILSGDMSKLEFLEDEITECENAEISSALKSPEDYLELIIEYRKTLIKLKRYYEQLSDVFINITDSENGILSDASLRHFEVLEHRTTKLLQYVVNIRDYVTQMREAYQAQIDIDQNKVMKISTVITGIFLPLTLLVGWYGMNFAAMPELKWKYSYPLFIIVCIAAVICLTAYFHKKKMF